MSKNILKGTETDNPRLAGALILCALAFLSFQDGLVKTASGFSSLWQFQFLRAGFNLIIVLGGLFIAGKWELLRPNRPWAVCARTAALMATMVLFFSGSPFLTLAEMGAGLYTYPIFMTLLSVLFLGERIGLWRVIAIAVAAVGAFMIVQPGTENFQIAQILPICAGFTYAINATVVRRHCRTESPVTMAAWAGAGFLTISALGAFGVSLLPMETATREQWPFLLTAWPDLTGWVVLIAAIAASCNVTGNILIVKAYQSAELSWIAPIDYAYLIFATLWGFILFSDLPDGLTVAGMFLIASAGILTAFRERKAGSGTTSKHP